MTGLDGTAVLVLPAQKPGEKLKIEVEKIDYNVKIIESEYTNIKTGMRGKGRMIVDMDNPETQFYEVDLNGKKPGVDHNEFDPFSKIKVGVGDKIDVTRHGRNLGCVEGYGNGYEEVHAQRYSVSRRQRDQTVMDFLFERFQGRLSRDAIRNRLHQGEILYSAQALRGQGGGDALSLYERIGNKYLSLEVAVKDKSLYGHLANPSPVKESLL